MPNIHLLRQLYYKQRVVQLAAQSTFFTSSACCKPVVERVVQLSV